MYKDVARLSLEHEMAVREVVKCQNKSEEKPGPGIDHIKVRDRTSCPNS